MKTRLILIAASLLCSPAGGAFAQTTPTAAAPQQPNAQTLQGQAQAGGRGANAQRGQTLAQNFQPAPGGAAGFGAQGGRGQGGARGGAQQVQAGAQNQGFAANAGGRGGPGGAGGPGGRGGPGGPGGPGGRGPGGRGPVVIATPADPISEAFRNEASAVSGSGAEASILMVTNYGWMRSTRTLKIGTEFQDGWTLKELDASKAVLSKPDNPDKVIDLSRWTGDTGSGYNPNANANGATSITFGSVGTVRSSQAAARPTPPPTPAPNRGAQTTAPARAPANAATAGRAPNAAAQAVVNIQGQAQRGR